MNRYFQLRTIFLLSVYWFNLNSAFFITVLLFDDADASVTSVNLIHIVI